jgi:hypothetical protein
LNILRKLGHIISQRYKISKRRARNVPAKPSGRPYMATRLTEGTDLNRVNNPVKIKETFNSIFTENSSCVIIFFLHGNN